MKSQILPIFPEPIVEYSNIGVDQNRLQNLYNKQEWKNTNPDDNADYFLMISKNLKVLNEDKKLKKIFANVINEYVKKIMLYENEFYMTTSWFTKTEKNKISVLHDHGNAMFSAVYYFDVVDGEKPKLTFEKPTVSQFDLEPSTYHALNGPSHIFESSNDSMLIFPSYLKHKVNRHKNKGTRKSLAMNFIPKGKIGKDTNEIYLSEPEPSFP
jgi:hypothetical protein